MRALLLPYPRPGLCLVADFCVSLAVTDASVGGGKELFMLVHEEIMAGMGIREFVAHVL